MNFTLHRRSRSLVAAANGRSHWRILEDAVDVAAASLGVIVCDMWDRHWCRGATERLSAMAPIMNEILHAARNRGALIIHAPSETMGYYQDSPARKRAVETGAKSPPQAEPWTDPPLPIDDSDGGCDSNDNFGSVDEQVWKRQHQAIDIDESQDVISDQGSEIYSVLRERRIRQVIMVGVHTNMCILNRSFGIKQLVRWPVDVALCRDLTDSMYNPEKPPYVDHDIGTELVVGYIESHWCPSIPSSDLG